MPLISLLQVEYEEGAWRGGRGGFYELRINALRTLVALLSNRSFGGQVSSLV